MLDPKTIRQLLVYGATLWPRTFSVPTNEATELITVQVWQDVLGDLEPEDLRASMASWTDHWPPTPRELREAALRGRNADEAPDAHEAFSEVMEAVRAIGYTRTPNWSHPAIEAAVDALGGWRKGICEDENLVALRAHFLKMYDSSVRRHRIDTDAPVPIVAVRREAIDGPQRLRVELPSGAE